MLAIDLMKKAVKCADDKKALDIKVLNIGDLTTLAENLPLTAEEAVKLPGIGSHKAKKVLPPFLEEIRKFKEER